MFILIGLLIIVMLVTIFKTLGNFKSLYNYYHQIDIYDDYPENYNQDYQENFPHFLTGKTDSHKK